jgi:hypothetical protein
MQRNLARRTFTGLNAVLLAGLAMALPERTGAVTTCTYRTPLGSNICFPNAGSGWNTATPESKGMTTAGLNAFASYIGSYGVVIKNGYKIYSWGSPPSQYDAGSGTKSLFGMVFARLKQDGIFTDSTTLASQGWAMRAGADRDTVMTINQVLNLNGSYAIRGSEAPGTRRAINDYDVNLLFKTLWNKTRALYNQNLNTYAMSKFGTAIGVADVFTSSGKGYGSPEPNSTYRIGTGNTTCAGLPSNGHGCGIHTLMSADEFGRVGWFFANSGFWGGSGQLIAASHFPTACLNDGDPPSTVVGAASPNGDNGNGGTGPYPDTTRDYLRVGSFGGPANSQRPQPNGVHSGWTNGMVFNRTAFRGSCGGQKSVNWRDAPHLDTFMIPGGSSSDYRVIIVSRAHKLVVAFRTTIPEFRTHLVGSLTSPANTAMKKLRQALSSVPAQLPACY